MQDDTFKNINPITNVKTMRATIKELVEQYTKDYNALEKKDYK